MSGKYFRARIIETLYNIPQMPSGVYFASLNPRVWMFLFPFVPDISQVSGAATDTPQSFSSSLTPPQPQLLG